VVQRADEVREREGQARLRSFLWSPLTAISTAGMSSPGDARASSCATPRRLRNAIVA
jgi:hypothetical protein